MTLDSLLKEITDDMQKPSKDIKLNKLQGKVAICAGLLVDDDTEVKGEHFDLFPTEMKKAGMAIILQLIQQTITE